MLALYKFLKFCFRHLLPGFVRYPIARSAAHMVCWFNATRRTVLVSNLTPLLGLEKAKALAPVLLGNFLMTAVDFFCPKDNLTRSTRGDQWGLLEKTYRKSHRVMMVTAHLGNWELGISCLVEKGYSVAGVYAPYREDEVVKWILKHRNTDVEWIPAVRGAVEASIDALKRGRVLGMVADIPFGERGRRVTLFGCTIRLPMGPWFIAIRAGATVLPSFIIREKPGQYRVIIHDPIVPPGGTLRHQIETMQDIYVQHLDSYLRRYPEQWGVLSPFWETPQNP